MSGIDLIFVSLNKCTSNWHRKVCDGSIQRPSQYLCTNLHSNADWMKWKTDKIALFDAVLRLESKAWHCALHCETRFWLNCRTKPIFFAGSFCLRSNGFKQKVIKLAFVFKRIRILLKVAGFLSFNVKFSAKNHLNLHFGLETAMKIRHFSSDLTKLAYVNPLVSSQSILFSIWNGTFNSFRFWLVSMNNDCCLVSNTVNANLKGEMLK